MSEDVVRALSTFFFLSVRYIPLSLFFLLGLQQLLLRQLVSASIRGQSRVELFFFWCVFDHMLLHLHKSASLPEDSIVFCLHNTITNKRADDFCPASLVCNDGKQRKAEPPTHCHKPLCSESECCEHISGE